MCVEHFLRRVYLPGSAGPWFAWESCGVFVCVSVEECGVLPTPQQDVVRNIQRKSKASNDSRAVLLVLENQGATTLVRRAQIRSSFEKSTNNTSHGSERPASPTFVAERAKQGARHACNCQL
eukprot:528828-Amphidinium_carterae.1